MLLKIIFNNPMIDHLNLDLIDYLYLALIDNPHLIVKNLKLKLIFQLINCNFGLVIESKK